MAKVIGYPGEDDRDVLEGFLASDPEAVRIVRRWIRGVVYCRYHFTDEAAEDLIMVTLLHLLQTCRKPGFAIHTSFKALVRKITVCRCIEEKDKRYREPTFEPDIISIMAGAADRKKDAVTLDQYAVILKQSIARLTLACRRVLALRFYGKMKLHDIAAEQDRALGTVKANLNRCIDDLRRVMDQTMRYEGLTKADFLGEYEI